MTRYASAGTAGCWDVSHIPVATGGHALLGTSEWGDVEPGDVEIGNVEELMKRYPSVRDVIQVLRSLHRTQESSAHPRSGFALQSLSA
jgi:hypothetical protein